MNILITAIGSMSAEYAINKLHENKHFIVGCDIYPYEWHYEATLCDAFYRAPYATDKVEYIHFLLETCKLHDIQYLIPLTDLEIDVINENRKLFADNNITLCMQSARVLEVARDKYKLYQTFAQDEKVPSIHTELLTNLDEVVTYPLIAKPANGRSSEGLTLIKNIEQLKSLNRNLNYIIQEYKEGPIFTVDYIRQSESSIEMSVPRKELLRTKNGAGLTVQVTNNHKLRDLVSYIGNKLGINGCVNMEFIENNGNYFLIDINPRFSAGVAFSVLNGYDMINNHLRCFTGETIDSSTEFEDRIIIKKYSEVVL